MDSDPPRRPPGFALFRSKSYHDPIPRKRGRQVLDDITYIVNQARNWESPVLGQRDAETDSERDGDLEARADGRATTALVQYDEQPSPSTSRLASPSTSTFQQRRQMALPPTLHLPRNLTNLLSSSPPSSPLRPAFTLSAEAGPSNGRPHSLTRSPSLRAPPPLRRASSSSSILRQVSQGGPDQTTTTTARTVGPAAVGLRRTRTDSEVQSALLHRTEAPKEPVNAEKPGLQQDQDEDDEEVGPEEAAQACSDVHRSPERKRIRPTRIFGDRD